MEFLIDFAGFALKSFWIVLMIAALVLLVVMIVRTRDGDEGDDLEMTDITDYLAAREQRLQSFILGKDDLKALKKQKKKDAKAKEKASSEDRARIYVLNFEGDVAAHGVENLARQINAILAIARPKLDEVVVKITSPGGTITGYGLGAAELLRLRAHAIELTACVDQVAASGGYLMAVTANKILAAPFAIVGSIGVVAQVPNLHRLLKKNDIDYEEITAGEYKRTVSLLGEMTQPGKEHFRQKLDRMHVAFKDFVLQYRPNVDIDEVGTGDFWSGAEALKLGLIDGLSTSQDYLFTQHKTAQIYAITTKEHEPLLRKLLKGISGSLNGALLEKIMFWFRKTV